MFGSGKVHVVLTDFAMDRIQFRFPRTKKKRIAKKWMKNLNNWTRVPSKHLKIVGVRPNGDIYAIGHINMKPHLEYLNSIAKETEGPEFVFGPEGDEK